MAAAAGAGKRIARSSVEWAKFAQKVPKEELSNFQSFKARSDYYVARLDLGSSTFYCLKGGVNKRKNVSNLCSE